MILLDGALDYTFLANFNFNFRVPKFETSNFETHGCDVLVWS
jgi:hypothetical protein